MEEGENPETTATKTADHKKHNKGRKALEGIAIVLFVKMIVLGMLLPLPLAVIGD